MTTQNVNIYHGGLVATGRKKPIDQYQLQVQIEGDAPDEGKGKKSKDKQWLFPDVLELFSPEEREAIMRDVIMRFARIDLELP